MPPTRAPIVLLLLVLGACAGLPLDPLTNEARTLHPAHDPARTLRIGRELTLDDKKRPVHELRLPAGTYAFEGEDADYWYMRASGMLELIDFRRSGAADARNLRGGVAIGKYSFRSVPAAVYIDGEGAGRVLIWKLGADFMSAEGRDWSKSF